MATKVIVDKMFEGYIPKYLNNRENDLISMNQALKNSDFETFRSIGHKISGTAASYGFPELGELAVEINRLAKCEDLKSIEIKIKEFETYIRDLDITFE